MFYLTSGNSRLESPRIPQNPEYDGMLMCIIVLASVFGKYQTRSELLIKICRSWGYHIGISSIYCCVLLKFRGCKLNGVNFNV